jgi:hypothetical protein
VQQQNLIAVDIKVSCQLRIGATGREDLSNPDNYLTEVAVDTPLLTLILHCNLTLPVCACCLQGVVYAGHEYLNDPDNYLSEVAVDTPLRSFFLTQHHNSCLLAACRVRCMLDVTSQVIPTTTPVRWLWTNPCAQSTFNHQSQPLTICLLAACRVWCMLGVKTWVIRTTT